MQARASRPVEIQGQLEPPVFAVVGKAPLHDTRITAGGWRAWQGGAVDAEQDVCPRYATTVRILCLCLFLYIRKGSDRGKPQIPVVYCTHLFFVCVHACTNMMEISVQVRQVLYSRAFVLRGAFCGRCVCA